MYISDIKGLEKKMLTKTYLILVDYPKRLTRTQQITETESKTSSISYLVTTAMLITKAIDIENRIALSIGVNRITDFVTKIKEIEGNLSDHKNVMV